MTTFVLCKTLVLKWLCSRSQPGIKVIIRGLQGHLLHIVTFLVFSNFQGIQRLSNLMAPIMLLTGHEGEVFCAKFSPDGKMLASAGFDRLICKFASGLFQIKVPPWAGPPPPLPPNTTTKALISSRSCSSPGFNFSR